MSCSYCKCLKIMWIEHQMLLCPVCCLSLTSSFSFPSDKTSYSTCCTREPTVVFAAHLSASLYWEKTIKVQYILNWHWYGECKKRGLCTFYSDLKQPSGSSKAGDSLLTDWTKPYKEDFCADFSSHKSWKKGPFSRTIQEGHLRRFYAQKLWKLRENHTRGLSVKIFMPKKLWENHTREPYVHIN